MEYRILNWSVKRKSKWVLTNCCTNRQLIMLGGSNIWVSTPTLDTHHMWLLLGFWVAIQSKANLGGKCYSKWTIKYISNVNHREFRHISSEFTEVIKYSSSEWFCRWCLHLIRNLGWSSWLHLHFVFAVNDVFSIHQRIMMK